MANDAKIRLQISTALDAAGIKATREQVDALAKSVGAANKQMNDGTDKLAGAIGDLPGPLGKIGKAAGGAFGKVMLLVGAFETGYAIGQKISEQLANIWPWYNKYINGTDDLEKKQKALKKALQEASKAFDEQVRSIQTADAAQAKASSRAIKLIEEETKARLYAAKTRDELLAAGEDAELMKLERMRLEDRMQMKAAGASEEALDQADRMYDVVKAQMVEKKQLAAYDRETAQLMERQNAEAAKLAKTLEDVRKQDEGIARVQQMIDDLDEKSFDKSTGKWTMTVDEYNRRRAALDDMMDKAVEQKKDREAGLVSELSRVKVDAIEANNVRMARRAILAEGLNLDTTRAHDALQDAVTAGNPLGIGYAKEYQDEINAEALKSYEAVEAIKDNTSALAEKIDALLQLKGN